MEKALLNRKLSTEFRKQFVVDEVELFQVLAPDRSALFRTKREFTWYVRSGIHIRSPVRYNGVPIPGNTRLQYERDWQAEEHRRAEREQQRGKSGGVVEAESVEPASTSIVPKEPRFVSEAFFMEFKFEPGNYFLAGREPLDGRELLRVEYYPTAHFGPDENKREPDAFERGVARRMNKTSLITLWVDPSVHQIVNYTFDNIWLEFLPASWLVRADALRASMTMGRPFPGVWLPRDIAADATVTLASGSYSFEYKRQFSNYREPHVQTKLRGPKREF